MFTLYTMPIALFVCLPCPYGSLLLQGSRWMPLLFCVSLGSSGEDLTWIGGLLPYDNWHPILVGPDLARLGLTDTRRAQQQPCTFAARVADSFKHRAT